MPCFDPGVEADIERQRMLAHNEYPRLVQLMCRHCRELEKLGVMDQVNQEVRDWWLEHKSEDDERLHREWKRQKRDERRREVAQSALSKLSDEELRVLGLNEELSRRGG